MPVGGDDERVLRGVRAGLAAAVPRRSCRVPAATGVAEQETLRFANQLIIMSLVASGVALMVTPLMNLLWTLDKVHEAEAKQRAIEAGRTYTHMPGRAATWFSRLGLVVVLAVLATPVYGLVVVLQLV